MNLHRTGFVLTLSTAPPPAATLSYAAFAALAPEDFAADMPGNDVTAQQWAVVPGLCGPDLVQRLVAWLRSAALGQLTLHLPDAIAQQMLLGQLRRHFVYIEAAGGVVLAPDNRLLLIHRRGAWDLPKGKLDPGETPTQAALREVAEETGAAGLVLGAPLPDTWHLYTEPRLAPAAHPTATDAHGQVWVLKRSYWYHMAAPLQPLTPQAEEDIAEARWVPLPSLSLYLDQTYGTIREVLAALLHGTDAPH